MAESPTRATRPLASTPRRQLLDLITTIGFGRIELLAVRDGQPVFSPPPRIIRERLLGARDGGAPAVRDRIERKDSVQELFAELDRIGTGVITALEVRHGLPFRLILAEEAWGEVRP